MQRFKHFGFLKTPGFKHLLAFLNLLFRASEDSTWLWKSEEGQPMDQPACSEEAEEEAAKICAKHFGREQEAWDLIGRSKTLVR